MFLQNRDAPDYFETLNMACHMWKQEGEQGVLAYLREVASMDYHSEDIVERWALDFFEEHNEAIILGRFQLSLVR